MSDDELADVPHAKLSERPKPLDRITLDDGKIVAVVNVQGRHRKWAIVRHTRADGSEFGRPFPITWELR